MNNFPHWADHLFAVIFLFILPAYSIWQHKGNYTAGLLSSSEKKQVYILGSIYLFAMGATILLLWYFFRRPFSAIGFTLPFHFTSWWWIVALLVILYAVDAFLSLSTEKKLKESVETWKKRTPFVPTQKKELPFYFLLCISAAVWEEIIYRGYLVSYGLYLFGEWPSRDFLAVMLPAVSFSIAHIYQGTKAVLKILLLAVFFGLIFRLSGSLLVVMLLHFLVDAAGGIFTVAYFKENPLPANDEILSEQTKEPES
jgi:membrane protease YdiL (CAAX protease family)